MTFRPLLAALLLAGIGGGVQAQETQRTRVLRVTVQRFTALPLPRPLPRWNESRGGKCINRTDIAAAAVNGPSSVDFILRDRTRRRAKLQSNCPALDYYGGFYLKPTADGRICQDRDAVHARSGGECEIDAFRKLTPARTGSGARAR